MKVFFDTSTLAKKYIDEAGTVELLDLLNKVSRISVSSVYIIEIFCFINRKIRENSINIKDLKFINEKILDDYNLFEMVILSNEIQQKAVSLVNQYPLASLDSIQLASAILAQPDIFVTSDKQLLKYAKHELKNVKLI